MSAVKIEHVTITPYPKVQAGTLEVGAFFYSNLDFQKLYQVVGLVHNSQFQCLIMDGRPFAMDSGAQVYPVRVKIIVEGFAS